MFTFQDRPFFDPQGNWYIPKTVPFGRLLEPSLKTTEWLVWMLDNSLNRPKKIYDNLVGSATSLSRIRKRLKEKGYK